MARWYTCKKITCLLQVFSPSSTPEMLASLRYFAAA